MFGLLKEPFYLIPFIIMVVLCVLSFKFSGMTLLISAFCTVFVQLWAKGAQSAALGLVPIIVMSWIAFIFSGIVFLTQHFS
jgi:hypothetical protein